MKWDMVLLVMQNRCGEMGEYYRQNLFTSRDGHLQGDCLLKITNTLNTFLDRSGMLLSK